MKRLQIIIVVLAVLSIVGLYSLPKVVVDNDEDQPEEFVDTVLPETGVADHGSEIPEEALLKVNQWKSELIEDGRIQNRESVLDSLMAVFQAINKFDSAAFYASQFADEFPNVNSWRKAGDAYYEAFKYAVEEDKTQRMVQFSRSYYNKILNSGENDLGAKNNIAMMLVSTSNPMQGVMMLREILVEDPENEDALFNMGVLSIRSQQFERGLERFESLVGYYPDHLEGNYYLGVCYFETGNLEKAKAQFEKVKTMDTDPMVQTAADEFLQRIK